MLRRFHSLPGLFAALLVSFMAITGAVLSLQPLVERVTTPTGGAVSVAELADRIVAQLPDTETITRSASGAVTAHAGNVATAIDPASGAVRGIVEQSPVFGFFTELHRSLFLGDGGRVAAGLAAAAMAALALTGIAMLVNRMGGWRQLFANPRGRLSQRLHVELGRMAIAGLLLSAVTGVYMALVTFGFVADGSAGFGFPASGSGGTPAAIAGLAALQDVPVSDLRELVLPMAGDAADVFTLTTNAGTGHIDQSTGALIDFAANSPMQTLYEAVYTLHTGQGHWWLAVLLGLSSLAVPVLTLTGVAIWFMRRRNRPRLAGDAGWRRADSVILVGSEGNTTWGFAATLQAALRSNGHLVHVAPMNALRPHYPQARTILVLAATYGNGTAPASARHFLDRLERFDARGARIAVLGFGDRKFRNFCAYAERVEAALRGAGHAMLVPYAGIDRQSAQAFAQWGQSLGTALGETLELQHQPLQPQTRRYTLVDRQVFGEEVQAPTVVLRFAVPALKDWPDRLGRVLGRDRFVSGDLVGIIPPGDPIARYYSIVSASREGILEICVRKQQGGLCSDHLHSLRPGESVDAFVRSNPDFHPDGGRRPLVLIGAGAGIAPLVGFMRDAAGRRPVHLYFGARDPASDFLYRGELERALSTGLLRSLKTTFSRVLGGGYMQDRLAEDAEELRRLVRQGARFMVCGSIAMGEGVKQALDQALGPINLDVDRLQAMGRYAEDVY